MGDVGAVPSIATLVIKRSLVYTGIYYVLI